MKNSNNFMSFFHLYDIKGGARRERKEFYACAYPVPNLLNLWLSLTNLHKDSYRTRNNISQFITYLESRNFLYIGSIFNFRYFHIMAKSVDESKYVLRFSDFTTQPGRMLPPIQGYENMPLVSLEEAVDPLTSLVPEVERMAWTVKQYHFEGEHGLTDNESASILLYTMEWEPREKSFYIILNNTLQAVNRNLLKPWFLYLRLIMTSLAKLPSDSQRLIVYRGVKLDLRAQYPQGSTVTWWGFSSCTTAIGVLSNERFLGCTGTRTLFNIECHSAKSIKSFSFYPEEEEVLLPPARQFQVMGCLDQGHGLYIIQLKEIQPKFPLINPVPQPSTVLPKPKPQSIPPTPIEPIPKTLTPPTSIEPASKSVTPPNCADPRLQKHIDALYLDPVIISFKANFL
jgi:hypothetical protein